MNEIRIHSWNELQEALFEDAWNPDIERYRSRNAFRASLKFSFHRCTSSSRSRGI